MWTIKLVDEKTRVELGIAKQYFCTATDTKILTQAMVIDLFQEHSLYKLNDCIYTEEEKLVGKIQKLKGTKEILDNQHEVKIMKDLKIMKLKSLENLMIRRALSHTKGDPIWAAKLLGCDVRKITKNTTLYGAK
jgi:hypothetical protein